MWYTHHLKKQELWHFSPYLSVYNAGGQHFMISQLYWAWGFFFSIFQWHLCRCNCMPTGEERRWSCPRLHHDIRCFSTISQARHWWANHLYSSYCRSLCFFIMNMILTHKWCSSKFVEKKRRKPTPWTWTSYCWKHF